MTPETWASVRFALALAVEVFATAGAVIGALCLVETRGDHGR